MYTNQLPKHHPEGGSPVISRPIVLTSVVALLSCGLAFSKEATPVAGEGVTFDEAQYVDLKASDSEVSYVIQSRSYSATQQSFTFIIGDEGPNNYILGNYDEKENYPLTFYYTVKKADSTTEIRSTVGQLVSTNFTYDAIGLNFAAQTEFQGYADLPLNEGESIDYTTLEIVNIFFVDEIATKNPDGTYTYTYAPDYSKNYILKKPSLKTVAKTNYYLGDFLADTSLAEVNRFADYSAIHCSYRSIMDEQFKSLSATYPDFETEIADGTYGIRMRFASLTNSSLRLNHLDGSSEIRAIKGTTYLNLDHAGTLQFLLQDLPSENVVSFDIVNATLYCDIWDNNKAATLSHSAITWRFGYVRFGATSGGAAKVNNYNVTMIVTLLVALALFAGAAYGLYRYEKNRFKNDEFNRVDDKRFLKQSLVAFFYFAFWTAEILFLIGRCVLFKNSLVVYNPFDPYIVVFSVALVIYTGYYIKYLASRIKDARIKKKDEALMINDTVADDGTVITKK